MQRNPTLGAEIEMPVARLDDGSTYDARSFFPAFLNHRLARGDRVTALNAGDQMIGVEGDLVITSVDNGFNNLESAIGVVGGPGSGTFSLNRLASLIHRELTDVCDVLGELGAGVVNFSEHPACPVTEQVYREMRAPKPIYGYWREGRGWRHEQGIDAKAQNGPTTGVTAADAVAALNLVLLTAPALIALYANSPFENGELTGLKENRLTIWPRMFAEPVFPGDRTFHQVPDQPFRSLRDYFQWMFGAGTAMQVLPLPGNSYKGFGGLARVEGDPDFLTFLRGGPARAFDIETNAPLELVPSVDHLDKLQFSQFLDGRIRFAFAELPTVDSFFEAFAKDALEDLFASSCSGLYIEGRACGATFPDPELCGLSNPLVAASAAVSPSALQKGLQLNPDAYRRLSRFMPWRDIRMMREEAIRHGLGGTLNGLTLKRFSEAVLDEAEAGLAPAERWMLAYPRHVLATGQNGADRALAAFETQSGDSRTRILKLVRRRTLQGPLPCPVLAIAPASSSVFHKDSANLVKARSRALGSH
ncbi:glutamate-cysteine ligase family protein [Tianweitania populi]|nr:glutamate-cysteine ligase family protein [Tianweitania populi]